MLLGLGSNLLSKHDWKLGGESKKVRITVELHTWKSGVIDDMSSQPLSSSCEWNLCTAVGEHRHVLTQQSHFCKCSAHNGSVTSNSQSTAIFQRYPHYQIYSCLHEIIRNKRPPDASLNPGQYNPELLHKLGRKSSASFRCR